MTFHRRCGRRITLSNSNHTATRVSDYNHGIVISAEPLIDDVLFEVRIDEINPSWSGSIEIGVTKENPEIVELPSCATKMRGDTWVMSGISVLKDGMSLIEFYGTDLDKLTEGDRVGVVRTSQGEIIFYINGETQGVAATGVSKPVYAIVNLYGKCVRVSVCPTDQMEFQADATQITQNIEIPMYVDVSVAGSSQPGGMSASGDGCDENDRLRFHNRCGSLVKLSPNCRTAERRRPLDEFNNGVVMTHRPLKDNEFFEIRIDKLVDKWSGSIEVGVTTHNPSALHFPATMTNMRSGTIMMSGCGILTNGKGTRRQYGEFNLDELREGDRVGMMRKANGNLHYYINGQDQGVAATRVAQTLWGVIDLYGMTIKVTIVDRDEREQQNLVTRRNNMISMQNSGAPQEVPVQSPDGDSLLNNDRLTFHPICGSHACVTHSGRTALRPNASEDFNNGVVLTKRPLKPNELFQVRLERVVTKWAGSIEIGVTTHSAQELDFPFTMTNVRSGTWMMTGNGVMHNGTTVIEQYGQNLDRLQVGDRVGVVRRDDGTLHFWVNGVDQGAAAKNVPERVHGVIDLYGQAAQASIVDTSECGSPDTGNSTISNTTLYSEPPLRFHSVHGKNARISNGGLTACRPKALAEFNDAIVFSNRPLRLRELFEVVVETMVGHWSGNIEIGVTGVRPDEIQLTASATDLEPDTIVMCGSMVFQNRKAIRNDMPFDLDTLRRGAKVGVMRSDDGVHFFVDGVDQGLACECRMQNVYAVIDLYGQCAQVTITTPQPDLRAPYAMSENSQSLQAPSVIQPPVETKHRWACISGNVTLAQNWTLASRCTNTRNNALSRCLVFSEHVLSVGAPFEIKITDHNPLYAGCLNIGVTDLKLSDEFIRKTIPVSIKRIPANVWYMSCSEVRRNNHIVQYSLASLEWLRVGDRISLELTPAKTLRVLLNSEDVSVNLPISSSDVYVVVELQGSTMAVQVISSQGPTSPLRPCSLRLQDSLEFGIDPLNKQDSMLESIDSETLFYEFSDLHGKNVILMEDQKSALRIASYNHGIVCLTKPLCKGHSVSVKVDQINPSWKGTLGIGALGVCPKTNNVQLPSSAILFKRPCWMVLHDYLNINGAQSPSKYGEILDKIQPGSIITLSLTHSGCLVLAVNHQNLTELVSGLPNHIYPIFDVYGKCEKITIVNGEPRNGTPIAEEVSLNAEQLVESDNSIPQCEKGDLEVHEKETEASTSAPSSTSIPNTSVMSKSVMESMTENLQMNLSIKSRSQEARSTDCLQESLQLQHTTNLNIQRSQSTQRFNNSITSLTNNDTNKDDENQETDDIVLPSTSEMVNGDNCPLEPNLCLNSNKNDSNYAMECARAEQNEDNASSAQPSLDSNQIEENDKNSTSYTQNNVPETQSDQSITCMSTVDFDSIPNIENKDCEYLKLVCGFKRSLILPDVFFLADMPICLCRHCYAIKDVATGWVRFKINQQSLNNSSVLQHNFETSDWLKAYYITRVDKIRASLDHGQPIPIEQRESCSNTNQKDEPGPYLVLHSALDSAPKPETHLAHRYISGSTAYKIQTAFEVHVRSQALCALNDERQRNADDQSTSIAAATSKGLSWRTKEVNACILTALLLKLVPIEGSVERQSGSD